MTALNYTSREQTQGIFRLAFWQWRQRLKCRRHGGLCIFARRLQLQERMTNQIAETIREKIAPLGVAVVCEGTHLCMAMRGVEKQNSFAVTSAMLGVFREDARTRMEFLELIKHRVVIPSASGDAWAGDVAASPFPPGAHE